MFLLLVAATLVVTTSCSATVTVGVGQDPSDVPVGPKEAFTASLFDPPPVLPSLELPDPSGSTFLALMEASRPISLMCSKHLTIVADGTYQQRDGARVRIDESAGTVTITAEEGHTVVFFYFFPNRGLRILESAPTGPITVRQQEPFREIAVCTARRGRELHAMEQEYARLQQGRA